MHEHLLEVRGVSAFYGKLQVLWEVGFDVGVGESFVFLGPNGAGKTTLIRVLMGLHTAASGSISFKGHEINQLETYQRARRGIIYLSDLGCFPGLSIADNIELNCRDLDVKTRRRMLAGIYNEFPELAQKRRAPAASLSGGQRKLLAAARAIAARPNLLVMDEPSSGLSPLATERLLQVLGGRKNDSDSNYSLLLAEQNISFLEIADRVCILEGGRIAFVGTVSELKGSTIVDRAYLG